MTPTKVNGSLNRPRMVIVVNSAIAMGFLKGQPEYFQDRGFDVTVLRPKLRKDEWEVADPEGVSVVEVPSETSLR